MSLSHEITDGVLLSRNGEVHQATGRRFTSCGRSIPTRHATVSHVQALVHKLPLCHVCYPERIPGGRHAH